MKESKETVYEKRSQALKECAFSPEIEAITRRVSLDFKGQLPVLENAIGAMYVGQLFGWKVLRIIHGSNTYSKYERMLGVKFKDICPERGPLAEKCVGLRIADAAGGFWKVATGKIPGRSPLVDNELDVPYPPE